MSKSTFCPSPCLHPNRKGPVYRVNAHGFRVLIVDEADLASMLERAKPIHMVTSDRARAQPKKDQLC